MTDKERIERLENKLKEALFWWRATEKQLSQKCKETKANQKTIEKLNTENAELRHRAEVAERALLIACGNITKELWQDKFAWRTRNYYDAMIEQAEKELKKENKQ